MYLLLYIHAILSVVGVGYLTFEHNRKVPSEMPEEKYMPFYYRKISLLEFIEMVLGFFFAFPIRFCIMLSMWVLSFSIQAYPFRIFDHEKPYP
jgi:hypothetical protein